jgi:hypothetical protein
MRITQNHAQLAFASGTTAQDVNTYKVTVKRGAVSGVGASVSGAGAWVKLSGQMGFTISRLETSRTYNEIKDGYKFGGGVSAFWSWIGLHASGEKEHQEITQVFHEVQQSQAVQGSVTIDMQVTGIYPNVQVDASAYVLVMEVEDKQGSTFRLMSSGDPKSDTGAQDNDGNALPTKGNNSTISL